MRYLSLAEALVIAEAVTGIDSAVLARSAGSTCLTPPSTRRRPASVITTPTRTLSRRAAVLAVKIARNHPLPNGNKCLAWGCLNMFWELNGRILDVPVDDALAQMVTVAAGKVDEAAMARWLACRLSKEGEAD